MLVYVAGPYRADTKAGITRNIHAARKISMELWEMGHAVVCPHLNTAYFDFLCPELPTEAYLKGDLDILSRCDAIVMTEDWAKSQGATGERDYAVSNGIPVYYYPDLPPLHPTETARPLQVEGFRNIVMKMYRVHLEKNHDYSPANILMTDDIGIATRLWDKVARLLNLSGFKLELESSKFSTFDRMILSAFDRMRFVLRRSGFRFRVRSFTRGNMIQPRHEGLIDSLLDLAVYAVIGLLLKMGLWGK